MKKRDSFRGSSIDKDFCKNFRQTKFYTDVYLKHKDEIIIGIRDGYINLYYNCDSIAKIKVKSPHEATIASYYTDFKTSSLTDENFLAYYDTIKKNSNRRNKREKQSQQRLFIDNNSNPFSQWFCIDLEYTKSLAGKENAEDWRFDIIAISKSKPFKVALIELKYGRGAMKEPSGIRTHVADFYAFYKDNKFDMLKPELVNIVHKLVDIGVEVPESLRDLNVEDVNPEPSYYFITLNNNAEDGSASTPEQTMSGNLFTDKRWNSKRVSLYAKRADYFQLTENDDRFKPIFLFSSAALPNIGISDLLNPANYEKTHTYPYGDED